MLGLRLVLEELRFAKYRAAWKSAPLAVLEDIIVAWHVYREQESVAGKVAELREGTMRCRTHAAPERTSDVFERRGNSHLGGQNTVAVWLFLTVYQNQLSCS